MSHPKSFSKKEAFRFGWQTTRKNLGLMIGIFVVIWLLGFAPGLFDSYQSEQPALWFLINVFASIISMGVTLGSVKIFLMLADGKKPEFSDLFSLFKARVIFRYFLASLLYGLVIFFGLILLVIPGIYFAIKYEFYTYFIVDKNMGVFEAFSKSGQVTKGHIWNLFLFGLLSFLIALAGILAVLVGLLIAMPVVSLATTYVYRRLAPHQ
jgi:uncharacterized membrane protein